MKEHEELRSVVVLETSMGWKQRSARAGLYSSCELIGHIGSLKMAMVRVFTPWKLMIVRNQRPLLPPESKLLNLHLHHH